MLKAKTESGHTVVFGSERAMERYLESAERENLVLGSVVEIDENENEGLIERLDDQGLVYR